MIAALLVSGLRIALPHLDAWRPEILNKIESATGMPVEASQLSASWQNFGPTLEAHDRSTIAVKWCWLVQVRAMPGC